MQQRYRMGAHLRVLLLMTRKVSWGADDSAAGNGPLKLLKERRTFTRDEFRTAGYPLTHSLGSTLRRLPFTSSVSRLVFVASALGMLPVRNQPEDVSLRDMSGTNDPRTTPPACHLQAPSKHCMGYVT